MSNNLQHPPPRRSIPPTEQRLIAELRERGRPEGDTLDALFSLLLETAPGFTRRATDGILVDWSEKKGNSYYRCSGIAIFIDRQRVAPFRAEFTLDPSGKQIGDGEIRIGDRDRTEAVYGSGDHERIVKELILDPWREYDWLAVFTRNSDGWVLSESS